MNNSILNIKTIFCYISLIIALINADNIRIPILSWEKLDVVSNVGDDLPEARRDYAIGYSGDQDEIIIYGGRTSDDRILSDTWIFNMNNHAWRKPSSVNKEAPFPPARYGMVYGNDQPTSNSYRNAFIITHGKGENNKVYNDVWSFDFIREEWVELKPTGDIPAPRYDAVGGIDLTKYSSLNQLSSEYLILSHGKDDSKYFTDTYVLKLDGRSQQGDYSQLTAEWIKLNTVDAPELNDGISGDVLSNDRLVVYGGCDEEKGICSTTGYVLNIEFDKSRTAVVPNASWMKIDNSCIRPKEYAAVIRGSDQTIPDFIENDRLFIFGGLNEKKYGYDADGEISIFDMDKKQFFGVKPSSKSDGFPLQTKGAKMISTKPKGESFDGFSVILFGGQPITDAGWSTDIWKLDVANNGYTFYPNPPEGVTKTECYVIDKSVENQQSNIFDSSKPGKEYLVNLIIFILAMFIAIPALVISTRMMNCFTEKWKTIFCTLGIVCFVLAVINVILSMKPFNSSLQIIVRVICIVLLIIYLIFPFIRPKQPDIDFSNDDVVNAAGVPVGHVDRDEKGSNKNKLNNTSSSTYLIDASMKNNANTAPSSEVNLDNESVPPNSNTNQMRKHNVDTNTNTNTNTNINNKSNNKNGDVERQESFLSPIFINPNVKEGTGEEDIGEEDGDSYASETEDEDEVIKKHYLSRAKLWLMMLRIVGVLLLISVIVLALVTVSSKQSRLNKSKIIVYIWIILVIVLYIVAIIIGRKKHTSMALRARRISFRPDEPLEPNPVNSWGLQPDQMKRFSIVSDSSYGKTSAYDDIGNVSNYSQSVKNYNNNMNMAQSVAGTNVPVIGGTGSNASPSLNYAVPPLPVTPVYVNNNGLFSIDPSNYNKYPNNQSQTPTTSSSLVNQAADPGIYKASEITNIPTSTSDYQSYKDIDMNMMNLPLQQQQLQQLQLQQQQQQLQLQQQQLQIQQYQQQHSHQINEKYSSSSLNSLGGGRNDKLVVTNTNSNEKLKAGSIITLSNSNVSNPSLQSQVQLIPSNTLAYGNNNSNNNLHVFQPSNNSSPLLEESPIQINTVDDQDLSLDFPQRNNTIEDMNDKEVMMVMTVPKRKLAVVNM